MNAIAIQTPPNDLTSAARLSRWYAREGGVKASATDRLKPVLQRGFLVPLPTGGQPLTMKASLAAAAALVAGMRPAVR